MFNLEFKQSRGCASEHQYHKDIVDIYMLYKDEQKIYSEKKDWTDYCLLLEINNLDKEIRLLKRFFAYSMDDIYKGCYQARREDIASIIDDLTIYIEEVKEMLEIQDYRTRIM